MDFIFSASIVASFFAGMAALFAPCCITVLLPAYLASAFREKRNILKMTFVFFAGIAVILIPIGLGAASLAKIFQNFHKEMYIFGGAIMVILAFMALIGKGFSLIPMGRRTTPNIDAGHPKSVFVLGIFSGAATSCCAPVLAGAITLAVISGVFWKALVVTFAYVFGMTFPLFIAAYIYDKFKLENSRLIRGKIWEISIGAKKFFIHSTNLAASFIFLAMGVILLLLAFSGNAFWAPQFQSKIGIVLNQWSKTILTSANGMPNIIWGIIIIGVFILFLYIMKRSSRKQTSNEQSK